MAYTLSERASGASDLTAKNRVWDFFGERTGTRPGNRRQPQQPRRKNRPTTTKTASGIPYWPSRDPIEEKGGVNLYRFVGNNGIGECDVLGLGVVECVKAILEAVDYATINLIPELAKYDPYADYIGGWPIAPWKGGGKSKSGGHYKKILNFQKGLRNRIAKAIQECSDDDCPGPLRKIPHWLFPLANKHVQPPISPFLPVQDTKPVGLPHEPDIIDNIENWWEDEKARPFDERPIGQIINYIVEKSPPTLFPPLFPCPCSNTQSY